MFIWCQFVIQTNKGSMEIVFILRLLRSHMGTPILLNLMWGIRSLLIIAIIAITKF